MIKLLRTDSTNPDFLALVKLLDADLAFRDGDDHAFYAPFNKTNLLNYALVLYVNDEPVSSGALKEFSASSIEVKRMYTLPAHRGKGYASTVLKELEKWAAELSYQSCVLETGKNQPEAIAMYHRNGFHVIPNYGQYVGMENSVCFQKNVQPG